MAYEDAVGTTSSSAQIVEKDLQDNLDAGEGNGSTQKDGEVQDNTKPLATAQAFISQILGFLSEANNETIGACLAGLVAITYLVLGRVGLVLIGIVVGVALHATWEGNANQQGNAHDRLQELRKSKNEQGFALLERVLDWREKKTSESGLDGEVIPGGSSPMVLSTDSNFSNFPPSTRAALNALTEAVIREYVKYDHHSLNDFSNADLCSWWYSPILPMDFSFPTTCRKTFVKFLVTISSHISRKRPADAFLNFLTNSSSIIIVFFNEFSNALTTTGSSNADCAQSLYKYLESNPDSNLANILDVEHQKKKLQAVADDILHNFLTSKAYEFDVSRTFLREVLAGLVLESTIISCSKQEWINGWIIFLLEQTDVKNSDAPNKKEGEPVSEDKQGSTIEATSANGSETNASVNGLPENAEMTDAAHKRTVSRAEYAMEEAMREAKRLSELIAAEEARKEQDLGTHESSDKTVNGISDSSSQPNGHVDVDGIRVSKSNSDGGIEDSKPSFDASTPPSSFTNFDQILNSENSGLISHDDESRVRSIPPLTLHNATVSIFDDSQPGEKATMRAKPNTEYLLQIEPALSLHPGWMISRRYVDFENLHEVLRRISVVSGVPQFAQKHGVLPTWKNQTKALMRKNLESYLRDALSFNRLAESEGMKRFLEKDQGLSRTSPGKQKIGFGFPSQTAFENVGKGMLDVLASAPKGAAGGGKAILGGVTGVFGGVGSLGQKRHSQKVTSKSLATGKIDSVVGEMESSRASQESLPNSFSVGTMASPSRSSLSLIDSVIENDGISNGADSSKTGSQERLPAVEESQSSTFLPPDVKDLHLPPLPTEIPDDYKISQESSRTSESLDVNSIDLFTATTTPTSHPSPPGKSTSSFAPIEPIPLSNPPKRGKPLPMTEKETQVAVELFFAVINELYTLSSAWNIRRTLLNAAKGFLLRPGNPNLEAIRLLLQETIIDINTSDQGIATHLTKLRENALPTADELQKWPKAPTQEEKEAMRVKARKLLVEKGMPLALTSVMGVAASGEALGRMFDCLQVEEVARGLMFSLILQGIKAVTQ